MSEIRVDTISEKTSGSGTTVSSLVNPNSPFRNLIINGDMKIAQRATGATTITNNSVHYATVDRFAVYEFSDAVLTSEQHDMSAADQATTGQTKAMELNVTTVDSSIASGQWCFFTQPVEAQFCQHALYGTSAAKNLTLSFWVKTNKTGTYAVAIDKNDSTRYRLPITYTVDSADTWEKKVINISPTAGSTSLITAANGAIADDSGVGFFIWWVLAAGSDFHGTNNTWVSGEKYTTSSQVNWLDSTDNNFHITGVQLEVDSTATDFEHLPRDVNLQRCQRYFYNLSSLGPYVPASSGAYLGAGYYYTSSFVIAMIHLPTAMRTEPTLTTSNASDSFIFYRDNAGDNMDDLSLNNSSSAICVTVGNNSDVSGTAGMGGGLVVQSGTICNISAEL